MTEEDFEYFSRYEKNLKTAMEQDYSSAIPIRDLILMKEKSHYDGTINFSCSRCTIKLLKYVGKLYFEHKLAKEENNDE